MISVNYKCQFLNLISFVQCPSQDYQNFYQQYLTIVSNIYSLLVYVESNNHCPRSQGSGVNVTASMFTELVTWELCVPKPMQSVQSSSKKPSKDVLPFMLEGLWTFTYTKVGHEDKGDEHRKQLAASCPCVKEGTTT